MFVELETARLVLKNIDYDDKEFMYKEFSTDEVNEFLFDAEPVSSIDEASEWIDFYTQAEPRSQHRWIIVNKANGEKIGTCGVHCWDREKLCAEIGYDLQPQYWRKGYMSEAIATMLIFAKDKMKVKKLVANIAENNIASIRTAEKAGFHRTDN